MPLNEVMTIGEAAQIWGLSSDSLGQNCLGRVKGEKAFADNEKRKSGKIWLVTRTAMIRAYGEPPKAE